jgi:ubiquinone/menaquinone biosynthesis C-methylase UbiE
MSYWEKMVTLNATIRETLESTALSGDEYAEQCNEAILRANNIEQSRLQIAFMKIAPQETVLDIGAGVGRLSVDIAKKAKHVTAIEPSIKMISYLQNNLRRANVDNFTILNKRWEEVQLSSDIQQHDVSIAAYSLTMPNLKEALVKINDATKKRAYIITSASRSFDAILWKELFGEAQPIWWLDHLYLISLLMEIGVYANVEIIAHPLELRYNNLNEATEAWARMYLVPKTKQAILKTYLSKSLRENNGKLVILQESKTAVVWWKKSGSTAAMADYLTKK